MSGSNTAAMNASLTLRLQDRLSAGLGALKQKLDGIRGAAERIGALGAIGSGLAIGAPIAAAARLDDQLRAIAITAGRSGAEAEVFIARLRRNYQRLAIETAQTAEAVVTAAGVMMARGLPADMIERLLPVTARVATAASADMKDVAGVVESISSNLRVLPADMERAMAMLVKAGKEGKVELRDMAREFPALAARANSFGLSGLRAVETLGAAIQVAAKASGTPSEAATNLANLFQSLTRPETLKNFEKMGVDFPKMFRDAEAKGLNPFEAAIRKILDLTKGDPFKLGALIGDMQAGTALMPFLRDQAAEYLRMRNVLRDSRTEETMVDFLTRMEGPAAKLAIMAERLGQFSERFGRELFDRIGMVLAPLEQFAGLIDLTDEMAPGLIGKLITTAAAFLAITAVLGVLVTIFPVFLAGVKAIGIAAGAAFFFVPWLVKGLAALATVAGTIAAPVLAVVAAVALLGGIAYTIWSDWAAFEGWFAVMWGGLRAMLQGFIRFLDGVFSLDMRKAVDGLGLMWDGLKAVFEGVFGALRQVMDTWVAGASTWVSEKVQAVINQFKGVWTDARKWFTDLWQGIRLPTGPDFSTWSNRPSAISNEPVGAAMRRRLSGNGAPAGEVVTPLRAPRERVDLYLHTPPGVTVDPRAPAAWSIHQQRELIDAYRRDRGPVDPVNRQ